MGVPKFFRYISERYPCLSELVKEYQIPEFDNLYLDMNGIVHNCSHPDDNDPKFRISEEKIFIDIFHYIEVLFRMIRPQKVFFMAIDGVAPRAKMNQQRGRRFRSAKDAVKQEQVAKEKGELLPEGDRFDSNCITPGTIFMAKLHEQLQYFVANKISTDKLWQDCKIILSGHETPGEGEHKIMDYIRFSRAQPGYDPNTRHCLYGLDADLIMLGLCSHEPHFSLLREEVKFGKSSNKKKGAPEEITFFLLHLSLMREYLEQEFISIKDKLSFEYNIESVIDDWVLMGFLVGNDFIPHLPNLHINSGALPILYKVYMNILPTFDGYINENGKLNLARFEAFMESLASLDVDCFRENFADLQYFESKTGRRPNDKTRTSYKLEKWGSEDGNMDLLGGSLEPDASGNKELAALIKATDDMLIKEAWDDDDSNDSQSDVAESLFNAEFKLHKRDYYIDKLAYEEVTPEVLRSQSEGYVTAIQWNLNYYYDGVCSWSWYYPHHYAPYISDIRDFKDLKFDFQLGKPFQPYEQLLAVLPADSRKSLPECYHKLMTEDTSPIIDYYPKDFLTDLNGKKQEWEAVVLIPFIDEKRLLEAMIPINILLTAEERKRNSHGPMLVYHYVETDLGSYTPPEYFPVIKNNHAKCERLSIEDIWISSDKLVKGVYPGAKMDVYYPGFPTMKHLKYTSSLEKAKVKVFQQPSREESVILYIEPAIQPDELDISKVATENLGKTVFVGWPHLVEAMVVSVSNIDYRYNSTNYENQYNIEENKGNLQGNWKIEKGGILEYYKDKLGIEVGTTTVLVHVRTMIGRQYECTSNGRVSLKKQFTENTKAYPLQSIVKDIAVYDEHHTTFRDISEVYKVGGNCFMLGQPHYGSMGKIMDCKEALDKGRIKVCMTVKEDPDFRMVYDLEYEVQMQYVTLFAAANKLGISRSLLSRISGCILIGTGKVKNLAFEDANKVNVGLNLKFPKKNEEVPGYMKKQEYNNWLYSAKALELIDTYRSKFPRLFNCLNDISGNSLPFEIELFPEDNGSGATLKRIVEWIKEQPYASIERKGCDTDSLEEAVVSAIETAVDIHTSDEKFKQVTMQVKPHLLYVPGIQFGNISPDNSTEFQVYDRVVNVRESFTVPLGLSGTIIAIHKSSTGKEDDIMIDVLFDIAFAGGLSINCSANRGYRLPRNALINKSHGDRQLEKKLNKGSGVTETNRRPIMTGSFASKFNNVPDKYKKPPSSAFASWGNNQNPQSSFANQSSFPTSSPQSAFPIIDNFSVKLNNPFPTKANSPDSDKPMENWRQSKEKVNMKASPAKSSPLKTNLPAQKVIPVDMSFFPQFSGDDQGKNQEKEQKPATDVLKALLKLDDNNTKQQVNTKVETNTVENFFEMHAKVQSNKKPVVSEYPSAMLMSYFVSNGMGCPLYTFSAFPENQLYRAEIRIPTQDAQNMVVVGDLCASRELACENVARKTLSYIEDTDATTFKPKPPKKFPTPPKQWCQTNQTGKGDHLNRQNSKKTQSGIPSSAQPKENMSTNNVTNRATKQTPFIPLQVTRQNVGKPGGSNNSGNVNISKSKKSGCKDILSTVSTDESKGPIQVELSTSQKPKRERKMRIAAVFPNNPE